MGDALERSESLGQAVTRALDDDMNTSVALSKILAAAANPGHLEAQHATPAGALRELHDMLCVIGIEPQPAWLAEPAAPGALAFPDDFVARLREAVPGLHLNGGGPEAAIETIIAARNAARKAKDFAEADRLRDVLAGVRVILKDSRDGTTWTVDA